MNRQELMRRLDADHSGNVNIDDVIAFVDGNDKKLLAIGAAVGGVVAGLVGFILGAMLF